MRLVGTSPKTRTTLNAAQTPGRQSWLSAPLQPAESRWSALLALILLCGALFFYGLNVGELYRTESLRAIIGAQMLTSGNWVVPTLYEQPLLTKPPGMYAAIAAASSWQGFVSEWSARLPSALAATAIVFLIYWYVGRQTGRLGGLIAAVIAPCTYLWLDKATAAEIDMLQVAWVAAALLFFFRAVEESERVGEWESERVRELASESADSQHSARSHSPTLSRSHFGWWLAALICVAGGVLTKWTAGVFFYAAAIPFLLWRGRLRLLFSWQHIVSALFGLGLCFLWLAAVVQQIGWGAFEYPHGTFWVEALPRVSHQHHLSDNQLLESLQHPFKILGANLPWSLFALLTLAPSFMRIWDEHERRVLQALHCWTWPNLLVWTILPDHATRHSFPLFPGITGLAALAWLAFVTGRLPARLHRIHTQLAVGTLIGFGAIAVAGGVGAIVKLPAALWWLALVVAGTSIWCLREGWLAWRRGHAGGMLAGVILTWVALKVAFIHLYVPVRNGTREPQAKAAILQQHVPPGEKLYVFQLKDEGIMFYYGRPVARLTNAEQLPRGPEPVYCILQHDEWTAWKKSGEWELLTEVHLTDEQKAPIVLVGAVRRENVKVPAPVHRAELGFLPSPLRGRGAGGEGER